MMIALSRLVAEGALPGDDDQRAEALRLLGIGLYLNGRPGGAERAFIDLIHLRPQHNLDPSITRPEVVAFFRDVRRRNEPKKHLALAFLPPLGQFQNDTPLRGWIFGGLEVATFGAALTTRLVLEDWVDGNRPARAATTPPPATASSSSTSSASPPWPPPGPPASSTPCSACAAPPSPTHAPRVSLAILPNGAAIRVSF